MTDPQSFPDSPSTSPKSPSDVSDLTLERYHLGELPSSQAEAIRNRLSNDASLQVRLKRIQDHEKSFSETHPAEKWVPRIENKSRTFVLTHEEEPFWNRLLGWPSLRFVGGFAVALMLAIITLPYLRNPSNELNDAVRVKGKTPGLKLYLHSQKGPESLQPGDTVKAGDAVQIEFYAGSFRYGAIVSVDGKGSVTWHWPENPAQAMPWSQTQSSILPKAFQLDSAPAFERFYLILSNDSLPWNHYSAEISESSHHSDDWISNRLKKNAGLVMHGFTLLKAP